MIVDRQKEYTMVKYCVINDPRLSNNALGLLLRLMLGTEDGNKIGSVHDFMRDLHGFKDVEPKNGSHFTDEDIPQLFDTFKTDRSIIDAAIEEITDAGYLKEKHDEQERLIRKFLSLDQGGI